MSYEVIHGDCLDALRAMPDKHVHCCVTSPPYWGLRDYGHPEQIGLEETPEDYVARMVEVFREVRRVLRDDGTLWLNLGDSYTGSANSGASGKQDSIYRGVGLPAKRSDNLKPKDLVGIPWRVALALQADGWYLRQDIIWHKPNPMPESVTDRCTKAHEYVFLLAKSEQYYYDADAIKEKCVSHQNQRLGATDKGRNRRSVWTICPKPFKGAHFAVMPPDLAEPCIRAGCPDGGTVLDPFNGSGTTGVVALNNGRNYVGIELNPEYVTMSSERLSHAAQQNAETLAGSGAA